MCNEFVCTLSKSCIYEPVCATKHCPYLLVKGCDMCIIRRGCKNYKRPSSETSGAPKSAADPLSRKR